jgi:hypothetical protein
MNGVTPVETTVLLHLDPLAVVDPVLHRDVVPPLAVLAREGDLYPLVTRHIFSLALSLPGLRCLPR